MTPRYCPVSVTFFQTELLKGSGLGTREVKQLGNLKTFNVPSNKSDMNFELCKALNVVLKMAGAKYVLKDVAHWPGSGDIGHRPTLAMYPNDPQATAAYTLSSDTESKSKVSSSRKPYTARCAYQWMVTAIKVEADGIRTGFGFRPGEPLLRAGEKAIKARAKLTSYAAEIMLRQHRTHLFLFLIASAHARVLRYDRNGVIVSHPINLATHFTHFLSLVYRLAQADKALQGFDTTVSLAQTSEIEKLRRHKPENKYLDSYKATMLDEMDQYPIFKVGCDAVLELDDGRRTRASRRRWFLVGKPLSDHCLPVGRCTKSWVCYSIDDDSMMFMKEQWRANAEGMHPELETYLRLREHGVEHVATVLAGGDVSDSHDLHKTMSQRLFDKEGINMSERIQSRLVLREVGRPLESYEWSPELIAVVGLALLGHQQAWEKAGILHRDISTGNILISLASLPDKPVGLLIDWDLCKYKEELVDQTGSSQGGISGTWPFNSALSLNYPRKPKELADDLESFVYVPLYCAFRWHKHMFSSANIDVLMNATPEEQKQENGKNIRLALAKFRFFYEEEPHSSGPSSGGSQKLTQIHIGNPPVTLIAANSPLDNLLKRLYQLLKRHYKAIDADTMAPYRAESPSIDGDGDDDEDGSEVYLSLHSPAGIPAPRSRPTSTSRLSSTSSATPSIASQDSTRGGPLDSHRAITEIFASVFRDERGHLLDLRKYLKDKVYDQFRHDPIIVGGYLRKSSDSSANSSVGETIKESTAPTRIKRKAESSEPDPNPRPTGRRRRVTQTTKKLLNARK